MNKQMEVTKKKIGNATFYIKPFPAFTAANVSGELASVLAPMLGGLGPLLKDTKISDAANDQKQAAESIMDMDMDELIPAITGALGGMDGDKVEHLITRLLVQYRNINVASEETDNDVVPLDMDLANEIFCGSLQDMIRLCVEVVRINFGGFFGSIAGLSGNLLSESNSEKTAKSGTKSTEN